MSFASFEPSLERLQTRLEQGRAEFLSKGREAARAASQGRAKFIQDAREAARAASQKRARFIQDAERAGSGLRKQATARLADGVQKTLALLPLASKRDLERLERKLGRLQRKLSNLEKADPR